MLKIGLTGGIASGKSTVARMFETLGAAVIDTDVLAREVVEPGEPALAEIRASFGPAVIDAAGRLDRAALRKLVFADAEARKRLESILHPRIRARVLAALERIAAPYAIVVVPLLVETGFGAIVDRVLVVDCPVETQRRRLLAREGIGEREADAMIASQVDRKTRLDAADDVVDNSGDLAHTREQVTRLHERYLSLSSDVCPPDSGRAE
ncbi:MAG TPA: dephospho-CoA kinase [Gammaproteobacteria bacterium]|nr:dephospho-CoA kinase [Gammaproteobacteria bacterium]